MAATKIIALTGAKTVGKTTTANAVQTQTMQVLHEVATVYSFAAPIKEMLWAMGVPFENIYQDKEAKIPGIEKSGRELLYTLGTKWGREMVMQNIWLWALEQQIDYSVADIAIIDDLRFENEAAWVKEKDGIIIKLNRGAIDYTLQDETETPIPKRFIDEELNCGDIEKTSREILNVILKRWP